jgi:hypothetical protein
VIFLAIAALAQEFAACDFGNANEMAASSELQSG